MNFLFSLLVALPVVSPADFPVGKTWTWDYFDQTGAVYSTERYSVVSITGSTVLIEMSSDYNGGQNLKPTTRILADISKCLWAYHNPSLKLAWSIKMYYPQKGAWVEIDQPNTLAFEEKFNCNPREYTAPSAPYLTEYSVIDGVQVFQQKLWRKLAGSWFAVTGPNQAIQIQKEFNSDPTMTYTSKLRP